MELDRHNVGVQVNSNIIKGVAVLYKSIFKAAGQLKLAAAAAVILAAGANGAPAKVKVLPANTAPPQTAARIDMVFVQGGTFTMGCTPEQGNDCLDSEKPAHRVTVSDFYIAKYEVTQGLWEDVMGYNPSYFRGHDNLPVEQVSWDEIREFIKKLNAKTGRKYRLPTEAEWEYAARGGNKSKGYKYPGSNNIGDVAWYWNNSDRSVHPKIFYDDEGKVDDKKTTAPVGTKQANELGIHDMAGNVMEWVSDWASDWSNEEYYYDLSPENNPTGPARPLTDSRERINRGCCFACNAKNSRVSSRNEAREVDGIGGMYRTNGLRLALTPIDGQSDGGGQRAAAVTPTAKANGAPAQSSKKIDMVFVQGGTFTMGCTGEVGKDCPKNESPPHRVTVNDFSIGKYEVTQGLWKEVMGRNPSQNKLYGNNNVPVETVSWEDVQEFIRKLNAKTGKEYRLPTEAEWEYAARGGNKSKGYRYSGSNNIDDVTWYDGNSAAVTYDPEGWGKGVEKTQPAGTKQANELGIHDMSGNVGEFVSGWYRRYDEAPGTDPTWPEAGNIHVLRGGGSYNADDSRVTSRDIGDYLSPFTGFRIALSHLRAGAGPAVQKPAASSSDTVFVDHRNKKTYKKVTIGKQTWMAENLNYMPADEKSFGRCYDTDPDYCAAYGRLYTWGEALAACPVGWHLPSDKEWTALVNFIGGDSTAGTKLKSSTGWDNYEGKSGNGTDGHGFSALPGGYGYNRPECPLKGCFRGAGNRGFWWSATEYGAYDSWYHGGRAAWGRYMLNSDKDVSRWYEENDTRYQFNSVRCVED